MDLRKNIAEAIYQSQDPLVIAEISSKLCGKPFISSKIRRSLEKAAEDPRIQKKMGELINLWSGLANNLFHD